VADTRDVSTYGHMFSPWETLFFIKAGMEASGYQGPGDRQALVEAMESMTDMPYSIAHPQGPKIFNGRTHQVFGHQFISRVDGGRLTRVHTTAIEDGLYPDAVDYTSMSF
jgi:branched-chain amino acid transport system substrate-binding protein